MVKNSKNLFYSELTDLHTVCFGNYYHIHK